MNQITLKLSKENESPNEQDGGHVSYSTESKDKDKFLQFISAQNDDLTLFRNNTIKELKQINKKITLLISGSYFNSTWGAEQLLLGE